MPLERNQTEGGKGFLRDAWWSPKKVVVRDLAKMNCAHKSDVWYPILQVRDALFTYQVNFLWRRRTTNTIRSKYTIACERRRISGGDKRQLEKRLRLHLNTE